MTLPIERARTRRPVTWLTILGVLLLPALVGGILVAALYNPTERLSSMTAAIVNDDDPVTIDGQYTPLGRQLVAGLVEGSDDLDSNLTWVLSNDEDATAGLEDGTYQAVVTIPANFSAAATSSGQALSGGADDPEQATIRVTTPPGALIVDDAIAAQVASAAASATGQSISTLTLENVFLGFTTLSEQLGEAADGADQVADGVSQTADGASQLADGTRQLADGAAELPSGAEQLASGADGIAGGAGSLASGLGQLSGGTRDLQSGAGQLAAGVEQGAATIEQDGIVPDQLLQVAAGSAQAGQLVADQATTAAASAVDTAQAVGGLAAEVGGLAADCFASGASPEFCERVVAAAGTGQSAAELAGTAAVDAGTTAGIANDPQQGSAFLATTTAGAIDQFAQQAPATFAAQFREIAANVSALGAGAGQIADGIDQSAGGASQLSTGAQQLGSGASQLADGAAQLADGVDGLATGTSDLAGGVSELAGGSRSLADGLLEATDALPSYTDAQAQSLAEVVADPVASEGVGSNLFGASAVPLLATLALWFGGLASYIAMQAATRRALTSRRPSAALALRTFLPGAGLGAAQGLLVAGVVQLAASYSWSDWFAFAGLSILAGVAFAAVNQALVAALGGAGRWVAALVGVLAVATGVVSTVPGVLTSVAGLMPTAPAYQALLGALTDAGGIGAAVVGLLVWTLISLIVTTIAVATRRTMSARALAHAPA